MYRSFKKFNMKNFNSILKNKLENLSNHFHFEFEKAFLNELSRQTPLKKKILRHYNNAFMVKELQKEMMLRSKLKKKKLTKKEVISIRASVNVTVA